MKQQLRKSLIVKIASNAISKHAKQPARPSWSTQSWHDRVLDSSSASKTFR